MQATLGSFHGPEIVNVSSLNLRMGRGKEKKLDDPISYRCTMCGKAKRLGKNASVIAKISYTVRGVAKEVTLCDTCIDVFADAIQEGPRVFAEAHRWQLKSRVARVAIVEDHLFCFKCFGKSHTHVFVKFDNLKYGGKEKYQSIRVCARCAVSYLSSMEEMECTQKTKYKTHSPPAEEQIFPVRVERPMYAP